MAEMTLEEAPRKAKEHFEKGLAALERNNPDYAMDMFEVALDLAPRLLRARKFLRAAAIKKMKGGKVSGMTHALSSLGGLGSVFSAQSQMKKKPEEAVKTAEKLLRKDPLNMQFINLMAQAATAADMPEVALLTLEIAKEHNPNDIDLLRNLAKRYQDANRMHDSRLIYEDIIRLKPNDQKAIKDMKDATALDSMQRGGWTEANTYRDIMKDTKEATRLEQSSKAVKTGKDLEDLIKETKGKIEREPLNINYKRTLADLYTKAEQYDDAVAILSEAQQQAGGSDPQIDRMMSGVRVKQLDEVLAKAEADGDVDATKAAREQKEAFLLQDAEEKVKRYPNDLQFKFELAVIYYERGMLNEAIGMLQQAQRNPQRTDPRALLPGALLQSEKAIRHRPGAIGKGQLRAHAHGRHEEGYSLRIGRHLRGHEQTREGRRVL